MRVPVLRRAVAAVTVPLSLALAIPAAQGEGLAAPVPAGPGWRTVATVSAGTSQVALYSVAAAGPGRAWAVGAVLPNSGITVRPLVESWNGSAWARLRPPASAASKLGAEKFLITAAASGSAGLWAFTLAGAWLRLRGTAWSAGRLPGGPLVQASLAAGGAVWAFGTSGTARGAAPYAARWRGPAGWQRTPVPGKGVIAAASAVSGRDIWAVTGRGVVSAGGPASGPGGLLHWTGARWHAVPGLPAVLRTSLLGSVLARSDRDIWVGGAIPNGRKGFTEAIGHWNGRGWTVVRLHAAATAARYRAVGMVPDGAGGIWALGLCLGRACSAVDAAFRLWHESGGRWTGPVRPKLAATGTAVLVGLASVARSVWAAGVVQVGPNKVHGLIALSGPLPR